MFHDTVSIQSRCLPPRRSLRRFALNNRLTYRDRQLHGFAWITGLLSFWLVCSLGAVANVGIGSLVHDRLPEWWVAGIAGAIVGSVWNYVASGWLTWARR